MRNATNLDWFSFASGTRNSDALTNYIDGTMVSDAGDGAQIWATLVADLW